MRYMFHVKHYARYTLGVRYALYVSRETRPH